MRSLDTTVEAEYLDGFVLSETEQQDVSAYVDCPLVDGVPTGPNTFDDILKGRPEDDHGPLRRFSVFWKNKRHDVDWRYVPDGSRPIRFRHGNRQLDGAGGEIFWWSGVDFGFQFNDEEGKNIKEVKELR